MDQNWPSLLPPSKVSGRPIEGVPGAEIPGYATTRVGGSNAPGSSARQPVERIRLRILDMVLENWLPFTSGIMSRFLAPRQPTAPWQSPFDVDSGVRITRQGPYPSSERPFPYPYMIGAVSNFMPMQDELSMQYAWGATPSGPSVGTPVSVPYAITYPGLAKVTG